MAKALEDKFGTNVSIGKINLGFLNRIIIDDFKMCDKADKPMLCSSRLSVNIDLFSLAEGRIVISSVQIFGVKANLYRANAKATPNYQFVIDSLSTGEKTANRLDLKVNSFIIRHGSFTYDQHDVPRTPKKFNFSHINAHGISSHIIIKHITDKEVNAIVKKLTFEDNSGLNLRKATFSLFANNKKSYIKDLYLRLGNTEISSDSIGMIYKGDDGNIRSHSIKVSGAIKSDNLYPNDFASLFPPLKEFRMRMKLKASANYDGGCLSINKFLFYTPDNSFLLYASGNMYSLSKRSKWNVNVKDFRLRHNFISALCKAISISDVQLPKQIDCLKSISAKFRAGGKGDAIYADADITTNVGKVKIAANKRHEVLNMDVSAKDIMLNIMFPDSKLGKVSLKTTGSGIVKKNQIQAFDIDSDVADLDYNGYTFKNIKFAGAYNKHSFNGKLSVNDPNCNVEVLGAVDNLSEIAKTNFIATVNKLSPQRINLSNQWGDANFSLKLAVQTNGTRLNNLHGKLQIDKFRMLASQGEYKVDSLRLHVMPNRIAMTSDFGNLQIKGFFQPEMLQNSIKNVIGSKLPSILGTNRKIHSSNNKFTLKAEFSNTKWMQMLLGIPLSTIAPITIAAQVDDNKRLINAKLYAPDFKYDESIYKQGKIDVCTLNDTIFAKAKIKKLLSDTTDLHLDLSANITNNQIASSVAVNYNTPTRIKGVINSKTNFYTDAEGMSSVRLNIEPSFMTVKDTVWNISPSDIIYNKSKIQVNHFSVEHGKQHIRINGMATSSPDDSICVDLNNVNVSYILDLVNFHSVEFDGLASGTAYLKSVLNAPDAYANLTVDKFKFQDGKMGTLYANACWNKKEKQIDINAHAKESDDSQTIIRGYVSPVRNYIDLGITARNTNIEFLESFCGSFMSDVNASANGFAQVYGDLSEVNLRGLLVADGKLRISTLNTDYNLKNDTIRLIPDEIIFDHDTVTDRNGNVATLTGALHHKHLTKLTYDLDVSANHFLCYDTHGYGDNTFYGTVYGSGNCKITGRARSINFDIELTPHKESFIEYNAAGPDAISNQEFITWLDHSGDSLTASNANIAAEHEKYVSVSNINDDSDMHINLAVSMNPDFTLRFLMDETTGDKISLNGSGVLNTRYFNKGAFEMFGTYLIDHGSYNLTIQNIIKKDFKFQQGSSIVFGGNPYNARLNLKAVYPVNGVSLADLRIGNSFSSNNVRVDCIMNIGGTPESIGVDFDFDMPTVNNDAKQMVRSLINSEEEMNQQVVYLLAIGRFYTDNTNNSTQEDAQQSQTSLAMQSLLSGTISQQVNSILGTLLKNNNWNFGTNISTGTEGFNNAEYEGIMSGSLFNNRLLINGQFGYRDNPNTTSSFIGDFDLKYLLTPNGNWAIKVYNQTNDRYFTKSSLNTQGLGLIIKKDFSSWLEFFGIKRREVKP